MTVDLSTTYLGLELAHPIVPSASPITGSLDSLRVLQDAGAPAVVLPSLFEEQIEHESTQLADLFEMTAGGFAESAEGYFPELNDYNTGPGDYVGLISVAKRTLEIPVIASLNGTTLGGWTRYATTIEEAGADALELNIYLVAGNPHVTGEMVEEQYLELVAGVKEAISIPLAVKVGPYFSSFGNMATRLVSAGADALVLFNRFYQPDIDPDELEVEPNLELSTSSDLRLPLRWIAMLYGRVDTQFAATSGVHTARDAVKLLMAGADVTMTTAALLQRGPLYLQGLVSDLTEWLEENEYSSVQQLRGSMSQINAPYPSAFERQNYMKALTTYVP